MNIKERSELVKDGLRIAGEDISSIEVFEIENDFSKDPLPAISPVFRQLAEALDIFVIARNEGKRFLIKKESNIALALLPDLLIPKGIKITGLNYEIFRIPLDSLYLKFLNMDL